MRRLPRAVAAVLCAAALCLCILSPSTSTAATYTLHWTSPGDDGHTGRATRYDLRYSKSSITTSNFSRATPAFAVQLPHVAGVRDSFTVGGLTPGATYWFALKSVDDAGNWSSLSNVVQHTIPALLGVEDGITQLALAAPWPNPATGAARFDYALPRPMEIQADAFDIDGRHVRTLASGVHAAGRGSIGWDLRDDRGTRLHPGVYLVRTRIDGRSWTHRVTVVN